MQTVQMKTQCKIEVDGHLRLDLPTSLPAGDAEIILTITRSGEQNARYDFSALVGRLAWRGDPVAEQRGLRDEW